MLPIIDFEHRPGIIALNWGHPAHELLPVTALRQAAEETLVRYGIQALAYGAMQGPGSLIAWLQQRIAHNEGLDVRPEQLLITGGVSQALDQICVRLAEPGDAILVPTPTYHLALRIFGDHPVHLVPLPSDQDGVQINATTEAIAQLRAVGGRPRLLYCVPTFANPSGASLAPERRTALVALAQREGVLIIEDDVYRELCYDGTAPPSLFSLAPPGSVVRLGSFSKTLAPGMRVGWMQADEAIIRRFSEGGLLDSGGGVAHFASLVVETFVALGLYDQNLEHLRTSYRLRRDTLLAALERHMPASCSWTHPAGGYFVWLRLPADLDSAALLPQAEAAGVTYIPGARFGAGLGYHNYLRLSFSLLALAELEEGVRRLASVISATLT